MRVWFIKKQMRDISEKVVGRGVVRSSMFLIGITFTVFFIAGGLLIPSAHSAPGIINKLSYQGRLTDAAGDALGGTGTDYCFRFSIYDAASGGAKLWPSGTPATSTLSVVEGVFNADIGTADTLDFDFYPTSTTYLNVEVNTVASTCTGSWESLSPRQQILATGYAIAAENVYGDLVRTDVASSVVQIGTGGGVSSSSVKKIALDVANTVQEVGDACSPNGSLWYNSHASNTQTLVCDNGTVQAVANSESGMTITTFTAGGTWTKADYPGLTFAQVIVTGSGAGGGEAEAVDNAASAAAGGGGAGATTIEMLLASELGTTETVTVGAGGGGGSSAAGANGTAGNPSSFGSLLDAVGGTGGGGISTGGVANGAGGAGGTQDNSGDINLAGGGGDTGWSIGEDSGGGTGGASYWGGGGVGGHADGLEAAVGAAGVAYGSGGGGAADEDSTSTDGPDGGAGADGVVVTFNYTGAGADLAEWYEAKGDVQPGDVVAISQEMYEYESLIGLQKSAILEKAQSGMPVVGIVASAPYQVIGRDIMDQAKHPVPVALAGRVPVKVSEKNGAIRAGDLLTISSVPGVAMRSTKAGFTIGRALEDSACVEGVPCMILVLVNTSYSPGALLNVALRDQGIQADEISRSVDYGRILLAEMLQAKQDITKETPVSELFTDRVVAGLEIIAPRVITDTLVTRIIEPVDEGVSISGGLEIGSAGLPIGITLYDTETERPYCVRIANGQLVSEYGRCLVKRVLSSQALDAGSSPDAP